MMLWLEIYGYTTRSATASRTNDLFGVSSTNFRQQQSTISDFLQRATMVYTTPLE
jgi:hypothetical protein